MSEVWSKLHFSSDVILWQRRTFEILYIRSHLIKNFKYILYIESITTICQAYNVKTILFFTIICLSLRLSSVLRILKKNISRCHFCAIPIWINSHNKHHTFLRTDGCAEAIEKVLRLREWGKSINTDDFHFLLLLYYEKSNCLYKVEIIKWPKAIKMTGASSS